MNKYLQSATEQWKNIVTLLLAVALFFSPWVLGYMDSQTAFWNAIVIGAIMAVASLAVLVQFHEWEEWGMLAMGVWLFIAPTLLGFMALSAAAWTQMLVGAITAGLTAWAVWDVHHHPDHHEPMTGH